MFSVLTANLRSIFAVLAPPLITEYSFLIHNRHKNINYEGKGKIMPGNKWTSAIVLGKMKEQASYEGEG